MYCTATVLWESGHGNRQLPACCVSRSRVFRDSEPVQDVLLEPIETEHDQIRHPCGDDTDRHIFLDWVDDMQHENQCRHTRHPRRYLARLTRLNYFLAGSAAFVATGAAGA